MIGRCWDTQGSPLPWFLGQWIWMLFLDLAGLLYDTGASGRQVGLIHYKICKDKRTHFAEISVKMFSGHPMVPPPSSRKKRGIGNGVPPSFSSLKLWASSPCFHVPSEKLSKNLKTYVSHFPSFCSHLSCHSPRSLPYIGTHQFCTGNAPPFW